MYNYVLFMLSSMCRLIGYAMLISNYEMFISIFAIPIDFI